MKIACIFRNFYERLVLDYPVIALTLIIISTAFLGFHAQSFRLDASSESLSLENDETLKYYRAIKARYGWDDYLLATYTPKNDLFAESTLKDLGTLRDSLKTLERIDTVTSILDVPLIESPPVTLQELSEETRTLETPDIDLTLAKAELLSSPFYKDLLISEDGSTTAVLVMFKQDQKLQQLITKQDRLREKELERNLTPEEASNLSETEEAYKRYNARAQKQQQEDIEAVRNILEKHKDNAEIHLGGVPIIIADSIDFIRSDLKIFGLAVLSLLIILLAVFFRSLRWIALPVLICFCVGVSVLGFLGLMNWPVTIVSANFISLLLIFTLSFCVHQIVYYRECVEENPESDQRTLVRLTMSNISVPCFYMVLTTMMAFGSLVVSDIRPVIDFGWMMTFGLATSFALSFTLMPALMMFMKPERPLSHHDFTEKITNFFARIIQNQGRLVLGGFGILILLSLWGLNYLYVQNRFIDYYKPHTEIYRGMEIIDHKLGGTTPLDIVIDAPQDFLDYQKEEAELMAEEGFSMPDEPPILNGYWFSDVTLEDTKNIHEYLNSLPETGKILSFYTSAQLLQKLDQEQVLDRFYLGVLYKKVPESVKALLFNPYISNDGNQIHFSIRTYESHEGLNRQELIDKIYTHLTTELGLAKDDVHLTGMVVLYNNVLQSLFHSQIMTLWVVFVTMFVMFLFLFRNVRIAMVAIIPNITITVFVLGIMGWFNIPLDIMTITIAAICFGIADDNTIHYVHRFMEEFKEHKNYRRAIEESHNTIGRAMYFTSMTIMLGFSILAFSNFVPTFYFGILTGVSMLVALLADIALLPLLLLLFKPMGKEQKNTAI